MTPWKLKPVCVIKKKEALCHHLCVYNIHNALSHHCYSDSSTTLSGHHETLFGTKSCCCCAFRAGWVGGVRCFCSTVSDSSCHRRIFFSFLGPYRQVRVTILIDHALVLLVKKGPHIKVSSGIRSHCGYSSVQPHDGVIYQ